MTWSDQVLVHAPYLAIILVLLCFMAVLLRLVFTLLGRLSVHQAVSNLERIQKLTEHQDDTGRR